MARNKEFVEDLVLEKATELFWKKGYNSTSIQDLVSYLGINRGSLYDTFGGKKQLFKAAFDSYKNVNSRLAIQAFNSQKPIKEAFKDLFYSAVEQLSSDPDKKGCFLVNITTELCPSEKDILDDLKQNKKNYTQLFRNQIQKGIDKGEITADKDPKALADYLFMQYNGLNVVSKLQLSRKEMKSMVDIALHSLD